MAKKRARFAINVDSGVVVFRSESTDALKTLWKLVDDETASAIVKKKISARDVIEAIQKSIVRADGFNWREYDKKRKEELDLYNVSERDMIPVKDAASNGTNEEEHEDAEVLSLKDLGLGGKPSETGGKPDITNKRRSARTGGAQGGQQENGDVPPENPGGEGEGAESGNDANDGIKY